MAGGELPVVTAQMHMQDLPATRRGLSEFRNLFQSPDCIDNNDAPGGALGGNVPYLVGDPTSPLEASTEAESLELTPIKLTAYSG